MTGLAALIAFGVLVSIMAAGAIWSILIRPADYWLMLEREAAEPETPETVYRKNQE